MGNAAVFAEAAEPEGGEGVLAPTYSVVTYAGLFLPQDYRGLIFSKWLRSLRFGNDYFKLVDAGSYYSAYQLYIASILAKPETSVRLAVLTEDKDVVLGFAVVRGMILDYVHVHKDQRRHGIGTSLIPAGIRTITHLTKTGLTIWGSKYGKWIFNPFA